MQQDYSFKKLDFDLSLHPLIEDKDKYIEFLSLMYLIRFAELKIAEMRELGLIGGPVHLGAGQEAIAVGISNNLQKIDMVFSGHRSHAHLLALGSDPKKLFAEVLGKRTGLTMGMGGSMHLWDQPNGFYGSIPIVAGTVPLAVGAALASKIRSTNNMAVAYFGDGAVEEGVVHESLNLARQLKVPILFVCENNLFSSHMHITQRQPINSMARFATANDIQSDVIDGNNILEVDRVAKKMVRIAREQSLPVFIEAVTYRHFGHVDWREDIDVGVSRSPEDLKIWKSRDPIIRLESGLLSANIIKEVEINKLKIAVKSRIDTAWHMAVQDPVPDINSLISDVYRR